MSVDVHVDSDWAKGPANRRAERYDDERHSGEAVVENTKTRALSTAEAEYAVITGKAGAAIDVDGLGVSAQVRVWTDSNAAKRSHQVGVGKTRHLEMRCLWLQDMTKTGRVKKRRLPGEPDLADT